jgi:putative proteasome-type protease
MTYCVGMKVDEGLVLLADSRTNAGVDHISTFRKVTVFERAGERVLVLMTAGNLAASQAVVNHLRAGLEAPPEARTPSLWSAHNVFVAAQVVGAAMRAVHARDVEAMRAFGFDFNVSCILGGQIGAEPPRLFLVYPAGNFIETTPETTYFQIGEFKYGKPIIDRVITADSTLVEATKCALISMDSTIRSNLTVAPPLDLVIVRRDELRIALQRVIEADEPDFAAMRGGWGEALRSAFKALPDPGWIDDASATAPPSRHRSGT